MTRELIKLAWTSKLGCLGIAAAVALHAGGCGYLMHGGTQRIAIESFPTASPIMIDEERVVTTPATVELTRKKNHMVVARNAQGAVVVRYLRTRGDGTAVVLNFIVGGIILGPILSQIDSWSGGGAVLEPPFLVIPLPPPDAPATYRQIEGEAIEGEASK